MSVFSESCLFCFSPPPSVLCLFALTSIVSELLCDIKLAHYYKRFINELVVIEIWQIQ